MTHEVPVNHTENKDLYTFFPITDTCNLSCRYCFYNTGYEDGKEEYNFKDNKLFLKRLKSVGGKTIIITGGEPMRRSLKRSVLQFISTARNEGLNIILDTNGIDIDSYSVNNLSKLELETFISVDSYLKEEHDYLRGYYDNTIRAIKKMVNAGIPTYATVVITTKNRNVKNTYRFLKDLGVKDVIFQPVFIPNYNNKLRKELGLENLSFKELVRLFNDLTEWSQETGREKYLQLMSNWYLGGNIDLGQRCQMGKNFMVVYPNGEIVDCFHTRNTFGNIYKNGSIKENKYQYMLEKEKLPKCFGLHCMSLYAIGEFW